MRTMMWRRSLWAIPLWLSVSGVCVIAAAQRNARDVREQDKSDEKRPKLTLKAQPPLGMTPARVVLTAELVGGANDYEDFYCPTIEWDWGDGTTSESTLDCEPYEAGKSEIKRRFTVEHRFRRPGTLKISFRLKRIDRVVAVASTTVQIQPGFGSP